MSCSRNCSLIPPQIATQQTNRDLTMTNYATTSGIYDQTAAALQNSTALGQAYDASKTDDSFYLPPEAFSNPEFQRGLKLFLSPDGKAARMIITHDVDPATPEGISHIDAIRHSARRAVTTDFGARGKLPIAFQSVLASIFRAMPRVECVDMRKCLSCKA